jgi:hypothetical protein
MLQDRRQSPRHLFNRFGRIYSDQTAQRSCTIVDLSDGGARLCAEASLPPEFTLGIADEAGERRKLCHVVWRIGVEFHD